MFLHYLSGHLYDRGRHQTRVNTSPHLRPLAQAGRTLLLEPTLASRVTIGPRGWHAAEAAGATTARHAGDIMLVVLFRVRLSSCCPGLRTPAISPQRRKSDSVICGSRGLLSHSHLGGRMAVKSPLLPERWSAAHCDPAV